MDKNFSFLIVVLLLYSLINFAVADEELVLQCKYNSDYIYQNSDLKRQDYLWSRQSNLYISPYVLYQALLVNSENYFIVDIRNRVEFSKYHINNSFNLEKESLKTKSFFKSKKIVLVATVFDNRYLENLISKLKKVGFANVQILDGGINYWKSQINSNFAIASNDEIDSLDKILKTDLKQWEIVNTTKLDTIGKLFPSVISTEKVALIQPEMYKDTLRANKKGILNILIVLDEKEQIQKTLSIWRKKLKANIFTIHSSKMAVGLNNYISKQNLTRTKKRTDGAKMSCLH